MSSAANLLTGLRILLTPLFVFTVLRAVDSSIWGAFAVLQFAAAAASDVWDGRLARRAGRASEFGRWFDHLADIGYLLPALGVYVYLDELPWWVPLSVAAAFTFYVVDSQRRSRSQAPDSTAPPRLIGSRIGHIGGVCNYILIGVLVCNDSLGLRWLPEWFLQALFALVPAYSLAAVIARVFPSRV
jgi:phosphatidylglycerophosphate synthase